MGMAALDKAQDNTLAHSLQPRHVTMISMGIIGAGIFVGSSSAIHIAGPAVMASYAVLRAADLCHHADAGRNGAGAAGRRLVHRLCSAGAGALGGLCHRLALCISGWW
jgi:hypothetical protein